MTNNISSKKNIQKEILDYLANHGDKSYRPKELAKKLNYTSQENFQTFRECINEMLQLNIIERHSGSRISHKSKTRSRSVQPRRLVGTLDVNAKGSGYIRVAPGSKDIFVKRKHLGKALPGDLVEFKFTKDKRSGKKPGKGSKKNRGNRPGLLREGKVTQVIKRGKESLVGIFQGDKTGGYVEPIDRNYPLAIVIPKGKSMGAANNDLVKIKIDTFDGWSTSPFGSVSDVLGSGDDKGIDVVAIAVEKGVQIGFPEQIEKSLSKLGSEIDPAEMNDREDYRENFVFTIDPFDAKDFDDAIHIKDMGNGTYELGIHVADVSHYVKTNTALDDEAYSRATSVYLVDRVIPMLPEILSNDLCSLKPNIDRLCRSAIVTIDENCKVLDYRVVKGIIHSQKRLTYEEAEEFLDSNKDASELGHKIRLAWSLASKLRALRFSKGSVQFISKEYKVILDENGKPENISLKKGLRSHNLIEEFMLLANRLVAKRMSDKSISKGKPVYRVHDKPSEERIVKLLEHLMAFDFDFQTNPTGVNASDLNKLLQQATDTKMSTLVQLEVLRSMAKAVYQRQNIGHFGLGFPFYTHFTSPIRRYPDLMVHRIMEGLPPVKNDLDFDEACKHCSEKERDAEQAERDSIKLKKVEYLSDRIGESFKGWITSVLDFGMFVELDDLGIDGLVHISELKDDNYIYKEEQYSLVGHHQGKSFAVGDEIEVYVLSANKGTLKVDFSLTPLDQVDQGTKKSKRGKRKR